MNKTFIFLFIVVSISIYFNNNVFQSHKLQRFLLDEFNSGNYTETTTSNFGTVNLDFPNLTVTAIPIKHLISRYYFLAGDYTKAIKLIEEGENANPYFQLGNVLRSEYYEHLKVQDSMSYYGSLAFEKSPRNIRHFMAKMKSVSLNDDVTELMKAYRIIENESNYNFHLVFLSTLLTFEKLPDSIKNISREIIKKFPNETTVRVASDMIFYGKDDIEKSISENELATNFFNNGQFEEAITHYRLALKYNPGEYINYENLGVIYIQKGDPNSAIEYLTPIINNSVNRPIPLNGKAEFLIGRAYLDTDNKKEACKYLLASKNMNNPYGFRLHSENCK